MGAAIHGVDVVGERVDLLGESVVVLERHFDDGVVLEGPLHVDGLVQGLMGLVEMAHERHDAAIEVEGRVRAVALVGDREQQLLVEVRGLPEPLLDDRAVPLDDREHLWIGRERGDRAGGLLALLPFDLRRLVPAHGDLLHLGDRLAALVVLLEDLAVAVHFDVQMGRQGVHDGHADPVETAGDLVPGSTELAAGVEDRVHDLEGGLAGLLLDVDRDAAAVVGDSDLVVLVDPQVDAVTCAVHRLIDRVVEDLAHEVMQAPQVGRADVHARTAADGLQTLEDLDVGGAIRAGPVPARGLRCWLH